MREFSLNYNLPKVELEKVGLDEKQTRSRREPQHIV
jgi:hypothetical protein